MAIHTAVVPVAGLGTRLLPCTKSQPKEMLPVGRKPVVQYVVEELEEAGMKRILFVTGRSKKAIEDHFDYDAELNRLLKDDPKKQDLLDELGFERSEVAFMYVRQRALQKGLGDAIRHAEPFDRGRPFVVALGDSILAGGRGERTLNKLINCYEGRAAACVIAFEEVPMAEVPSYGVAAPASGQVGDVFEVADLIEKPSVEEAPSNLAIAARYVLSPLIFEALAHTPPGKNNEIQLTDAIRLLLRNGEKVYGVRLSEGERRYDIGNFESYFKSFVEFALADEKYGPALREHTRQLLA